MDIEKLCKRLEEHATDWDGRQMPDLEPAKGDPTAGTLRAAATRIRALTAENEALRRERDEVTSCAACGGPYPNADCGHARNAADVFQPAPCRPDTTRSELEDTNTNGGR